MLVLSLSEQFGDFQFVTTQHEIYNIIHTCTNPTPKTVQFSKHLENHLLVVVVLVVVAVVLVVVAVAVVVDGGGGGGGGG